MFDILLLGDNLFVLHKAVIFPFTCILSSSIANNKNTSQLALLTNVQPPQTLALPIHIPLVRCSNHLYWEIWDVSNMVCVVVSRLTLKSSSSPYVFRKAITVWASEKKLKLILEVKQVFMRDQGKGWKQRRHQTN